jgi:DNA repair exonuclease SbcCD ATPase subunit
LIPCCSFSSYRGSSDECFQAAADAQTTFGNQLVTQIMTLLDALRATSVQEIHLAGLREDKIRLEEQLKSGENLMREIREDKTSARARESHLRNATDSLLNQLKTLRDHQTTAHKPAPHVDERHMLGTWQMKYTSMSDELQKSKEHISMREDEIRQGKEEVRALSERLERAQTERDAAIQSVSEAKDRHSAQESEIGKLHQKVRFSEWETLKKRFGL